MTQAPNPSPSSARLLVTGATGLLGQEVARQAARIPHLSAWGTWHTRRPDASASPRLLGEPLDTGAAHGLEEGFWLQLDVTDPSAVSRLVDSIRPTAIVHTAYAKDGPLAEPVTAGGTRHIAQAAAAVGARLVHMSSDVIFDGEHAPYDETAPPAPLHDYGRAKAKAEASVGQLTPSAAIVRTSLICRLQPPDAVSGWILDSLRERRPITLFTDEIRSPVWVEDLAAAVLELALERADFAGVLNVAGPQALSRYEMGLRLAHRFGLDASAITAGESRHSSLQRPRDCHLDTRLAQRLLRTRLRSYDEGLGA